MRLHRKFEWDRRKAKLNIRRHRVSFDEAATVLAEENGDIHLIEEYDDEHSDEEDRYRTIGSHPQDRGIVLCISWTEREDEEGSTTRILSARRDTLGAETICRADSKTESFVKPPTRFRRRRRRISLVFAGQWFVPMPRLAETAAMFR
jgi:uncharacterized DUF497 family protein